MKEISFVYHGGCGHATSEADGIGSGIESANEVAAILIAIDQDAESADSDWQALDASTSIVFGSPTCMGMASLQFKNFADATSKRWFSQDWKNKIAAGFTNWTSMNGDKHSTLHCFMAPAMQHSMLWGGTCLMLSDTRAARRDDINYPGSFGGLMAQSPSDAGTHEAPASGDIETAKHSAFALPQFPAAC
jgi:NAD(P)H dehydrogenase (quinone)